MYKLPAAFFSAALIFFCSESFALNTEPKEPSPKGALSFPEEIDEQLPPAEPDFDNFEIKEPEFIEPEEPDAFEKHYDKYDKEPETAEPAEPDAFERHYEKGGAQPEEAKEPFQAIIEPKELY